MADSLARSGGHDALSESLGAFGEPVHGQEEAGTLVSAIARLVLSAMAFKMNDKGQRRRIGRKDVKGGHRTGQMSRGWVEDRKEAYCS